MKVLLLNPSPGNRIWYRAEHLGIAYLAAVLRQAGHEVHLLDSFLEDLDVDQTYQAIQSRFPHVDMLGVTATEPETIKAGMAVVKKLRGDGFAAHVTAGGYLPTFWSEELLREYPETDSVVVGEGEETLKELVQALNGGYGLTGVAGLVFRDGAGQTVHNRPRPLIHDLDQLPFPARDYLSVAYKRYHHAVVAAGRGCYHRCSFCQIAQFYRQSEGSPYRTRSARNIADEVEMLVKEYGVRSIFFVDDEFITESARRRRMIEELIEEIRHRELSFSFSIQYRADTGCDERLLRSLKEVGLRTVFIGVESGVESVLQRFDKGIRRTDIDAALRIVRELELSANIGYMLYNPETTFAELRASAEYLLSPEAPAVLKLIGMTVLRGTPEEQSLWRQGQGKEGEYTIRYQLADPSVAAFARLLGPYSRIYEPVARDYYELHFMVGDLSPAEREAFLARIRPVEKSVQDLHRRFLAAAMDGVSRESTSLPEWLNELRVSYEALHRETQQLLADGAAAIAAQDTSVATRRPE
jgi:anaerobic magnesium-protoporphyrin IX monomethyl ester cyclase